jgi:hypothetical protein
MVSSGAIEAAGAAPQLLRAPSLPSAPAPPAPTPGKEELSRLRRAAGPPGLRPLSPEEERRVEALEALDRRVRAHEQAHRSMGAGHVRGPIRYDYETGPDGRRYAVGGEVLIDTAPVHGRPEETIRKMRQIQQAALAPADPSGQDRRVAAEAARVERQARRELEARPAGAAAPHGGQEPCGSCGLARYARAADAPAPGLLTHA